MPTIRVEIPSRNQAIEFDQGTPESVIQDVIKRDFPRNGQDVAYEVNQMPGFSKTISDEDFSLYEKFVDQKKTDLLQTALSAAGGMVETVGKGIKGLFEIRNLSPEVAASTALESGLQGTRDLYGMVAQSEDPSSFFFKFKDLLDGTSSVSERKKQWLEARDFVEQTQKYEVGKETVSGLDPALVNNDVKNTLKLIADPTLFIPGVGEVLGAGKLGTKVTGLAMKGTGAVATAVTKPLSEFIGGAARMAGEAIGADAGKLRNVAAGAGVTGYAMGIPGVGQAAAVVGAIEGANKAGQVLERAGEQLMNAPTRIGALESLALNPNASAFDRAIAKVGRYGGDDIIDIGSRTLAGGVEGAAIGTVLGGLAGGEEGAAAGFGSGGVLGAGGAGIARVVDKASGKAAVEARHNDFNRFYENLDKDTQSKFDTVVQNSGIDGAAQVMDISGIIRGKFNDADVRFSNADEFAKKYGQDARGVQIVEGERPVVDINVDKFNSQATVGHELFHAFKAIDQLRPLAERAEQMIVGNYIIDANGQSVRTTPGLLDDVAVLKKFDEYVTKLKPDENSKWAKANTLVEKSKLVGEELGAEYMSRLIQGSDTDAMLRGFDGLTRTILDKTLLSNTEGFLRRTAQSIGLGSKPIESLVFTKLEQASPALNAALRDMVRARRNMNKKIELAEDTGFAIRNRDLVNPAAAKIATDMGIAETGVDGVTRMKPDDVLAQEDRVSSDALTAAIKSAPVVDVNEPRLREVDGQITGDGISNAQLAAIQASPNIIDKVKKGIAILKDSIESGNVIFIRNGKATKETKSPITGKKLKRYNDGVRITERDIVPYALATSQAGELFVRTFDISKARNEAMSLASRDRLGPYKADFQTFYGDLARYLNNLSDRENAVPTKELFGDAAKAAYMTDFFGGKDGTAAKYIRNFTLDRMIDMRPTGEKVSMSQLAYDRNKTRFMPAENLGDSKVFNSPDSGYRIISKSNNKHSLYAPTGERIGIYDTQAKAESVAQTKANPRVSEKNIPEPVVDADHTVAPGTPAPDSAIRDIPTSGAEIPWADSEVNYQPSVLPEVFPDMTPKLLSQLERISPTLAAIHIDRMRVGSYKGIDLQGGFFYPAIVENLKKGVVWAFNSVNTASGVAKRAAANGGLVKLVLMQEGNVIGNKTFTRIWFNDLNENIAAGKISKSDALAKLNEIRQKHAELTIDEIAEIQLAKSKGEDKAPRKITGHVKEWNNLKEAERAITNIAQQTRGSTYFQKKAEKNKIAYQVLLSQKMTKMGFPDAVQIVRDIEEPAFKNVPKGASVGILKFDPMAPGEKIKTAKEVGVPEHYSYEYVLKGKPVAKIRNFKIIDEAFPATRNQILTQQNVDFPIRESIPAGAKQAHGTVNFMPAAPDTPAFKEWFGESKVVDESGKPQPVYRGGPAKDWRTGKDITEFKSKNGPWAGFFTSDPNVGSKFAEAFNNGVVTPAFVNISKPLEIDAGGKSAKEFQIDASVVGGIDSPIRKKLLSGSYDGLILRNTSDEGDIFVPLKPTQIKSATGNVGTFDSTNPDIRFMPAEKLPNGQAWSTDNNYRVIQKEGGKYRVYAPTGTLIGVADTLDKSKKLIEKRSR